MQRFFRTLAGLANPVALFLFCIVLLAAGSEIADTEGFLERIRTRMGAHLSQLPNYTCHEVIQRLIRRAGSGSLDRQDTVELEVAFVGKQELFARPGEAHFEEALISKLVPAGTIGNG